MNNVMGSFLTLSQPASSLDSSFIYIPTALLSFLGAFPLETPNFSVSLSDINTNT